MSDRKIIWDHRPQPGPLYWEWRCLVCEEPCDCHATWLDSMLRRVGLIAPRETKDEPD